MKTTIITVGLVVGVGVGGFFALNRYIYNAKQAPVNTPGQVAVGTGYMNASYIIEGKTVELKNGLAETEAVEGSSSKVTTRVFGNSVEGDFNRDGMNDVAFLLTQESAGTGTFFYVAVALKTPGGYVGTNALLLGDRIAPQTTEFRDSMITVNYADRKMGEPFTAQPSIGVSRLFSVLGNELVEAMR